MPSHAGSVPDAPVAHGVNSSTNWTFLVVGAFLCALAGTAIGWYLRPDATGMVGGFCFVLTMFAGVVASPVTTLSIFNIGWAASIFLLKEAELVTVGGTKLTLSRALGGVLLASIAGRLFWRVLVRRDTSLPPKSLRFYGLFLVYVAVGALRSPDKALAVADLLRITAGSMALYCLWLELDEPAKVARFHRFTIIGTAIAAFMTIALWLGGIGANYTAEGVIRVEGSFGGANETGGLAVLGAALVLPLLARWRAAGAMTLWLPAMGLFAGAAVLSLSRTAIIGLVLLFGVWMMFDVERAIRRRTKIALALLGLTVLVGALYVRGFDDLLRRMADVPGVGSASISQDQAGSGRVGLWKFHWQVIRGGSPFEILFGHGLGSSMVSSRIMFAGKARQEEVLGVHNSYLWMLEETGVVGTAIYACFVIALFLEFRRLARDGLTEPGNVSMGVAFIAYLVSFQLSMELFGWNITRLGIRWYFLSFVAIFLASGRVPFAHLRRRGLGAPGSR